MREAGAGDSNKLQDYEMGLGSLLTPHEARILQLMADGATIDSAAASFNCSSHTIRTHLRRAYMKLDVHTRAHAVAKCIRKGIIR